MNNKNYFIFAAAIALASCSVDEYMGENPEFTQTTKENIIGFGGGTGSMSRVTQNTGTTEQMLDKQFKVYGWKTVNSTSQKVFDNYSVWYKTDNTPSNPNGDWEYVGNLNDTPTTGVTLNKNQYIKYWDYSATDYRFVAGSPISAFTFNPTSGKDDIASATVTGLGGHITPNTGEESTAIQPDPVYIAQPKVITPNNHKNAVELQFTRLQTKVRVGIYETIKGYSISAIKFYKKGDSGLEEESTYANNVVLTSSGENFYGGTGVTANVTYDWDEDNDNANPFFKYEYNNAIPVKNWYGGEFASGIQAISSNESNVHYLYGTDTDMNDKGYFTVIPNNNNQAIIIKCDYTLTAEGTSGETINVTGATAAIPAAYCKWEPNKMYTYIFKISQETNGTTGTGADDPVGLYPITFDAVVTAETVSQQGTETIINTPSITTYQAGSVTTNGIEYNKVNKKIFVTVTDNSTGVDKELNQQDNTIGCLKVYNCGNSSLVTEADLQASGIKDTYKQITGDENISVSGTKATFTPQTAGYYAIQYCYEVKNTTPVYKYKVIEVKSSGN